MAVINEPLSDQIDREKRNVSYDAYDLSVQQLLDMVATKQIEIAPEYQRHFVWDEKRESELIESVFLGIPIPSVFMATNKDSTWEVVDGVQRLSTLLHFAGNVDLLPIIGRDKPLKIKGLEKLSTLNDRDYASLPKSIQLQFILRPLRVTTLNDRSDLNVRYELFERLNTGGVKLHPQEIRNCIFRGKVRNQLKVLSESENFRKVVVLRDTEETNALYEECVLRFFAFFDRYKEFVHIVERFLTDYAKDKNLKGIEQHKIEIFLTTVAFLAAELPDGIVRNRRSTPLNLFEAVTVGTALVFEEGKAPKTGVLSGLLKGGALDKYTKGGTNTRSMVTGRIELVRDALS